MRRPTTLLEFAIAATLAILPIMLGIVLLVAMVRPVDPGSVSWRGAPERYVSVRHVAALKTFEAAIVERSALTLGAPTSQQLLEGLPQCRREWAQGWRANPWLSWLPPASRQGTASPAEQVAAQLAAFDAALLRFATRANRRVTLPVGFDAARWFQEAGRSLGTAIESPDYPGRHSQLRCSDLATALAALLDGDARMLDAFTWRGSAASTSMVHWRPDQQVEIAPQHVARRNPWSGIAGCVFLGREEGRAALARPSHFVASARSAQGRLCDRVVVAGVTASASAALAPQLRVLAGEPGLADAVDDSRWMVPPSLSALLQPLESLRQPTGALYRAYVDPEAGGPTPARVLLDGSAVEMGPSIELTIEPALQALAQRTAACYTGRHEICRGLGLRRRDDKDQPPGGASIGLPNSSSCLPQFAPEPAWLAPPHPAFQPNTGAIACTAQGRSQDSASLSRQNIRSRKRAESDRSNWLRRLLRAGAASDGIAARSAAIQRSPTSGSERKAAAMIGLIVDAGIASWKTAGLSSASGRY